MWHGVKTCSTSDWICPVIHRRHFCALSSSEAFSQLQMPAIFSNWTLVTILLLIIAPKHYWARHSIFHKGAFVASWTIYTYFITSIRVFFNVARLLHTLVCYRGPTWLCKNTRSCKLPRPSTRNTCLDCVKFSCHYSSVSTISNRTKEAFGTLYTEGFGYRRTARIIVNGTIFAVLFSPVPVVAMWTFYVMSSCLVFAILSRRASCAVGLANIGKPSIWTSRGQFVLEFTIRAGWANCAETG